MVIEAGVNVVCREETFWLTESDWCFKKVFHTVFDVLVTWSYFVSNSVYFWRKGKCFTLLSQSAAFFFPSRYHICDQFLWTCPQKNICIANWLLLLKKDLKIKAERRRNHWQKRVVFQKTFWTSPRKTGNFEGIVFFLCLVNEISRKSFPNNYRSVEAKFILSKEILKTVNEFAFCLLIGQIGSSFFVEEMFRVSFIFSCLYR